MRENLRICVVGLGHIGLPLAVQYASSGFPVIGCDKRVEVVNSINSGLSPIKEEDDLVEKLSSAVKAGLLKAMTDTEQAVKSCNVVVIIVPLVVDRSRNIDYKNIDDATRSVAGGLQKGALVVYETTLPPGDTRNRFGSILEMASGLHMGKDFYLVYSPERVLVGRIFADLKKYPKIVAGVDEESTQRGIAFYSAVLQAKIMPVSSSETAEMIKLMETTYRDVNIALANEFARYAARHQVNVREVIEAANTQPYSHIHTPGIGVGGHCIPVYPYFLLRDGDALPLVRQAREINESMPSYCLDILSRELGGLERKRILILGLSYRENVKESSFTVALDLIERLREKGAEILVHDPLFTQEEIRQFGVEAWDGDASPVADAAILQAYHDEYRILDFGKLSGCRVLLDGRNVLDAAAVEKAGIKYLGVGV